MGHNEILRKFTEWEYWPSYMFYAPNVPYAIYLALKAKNFTFYSAVNPGIKSSGNGTESKFKTLAMIPETHRPKSVFVAKERDHNVVLKEVKDMGLDYPIIAKPDVGFRGLFVQKINDEQQLIDYLEEHPLDLIIQEFIGLPQECGVFYYKFPNEKKGKISSLTLKSFMSITGDGQSTIAQLIRKNSRAKHYIERLQVINKDIWHDVPAKNQQITLSEIGNHARGTQFHNGNDLIDSDLEKTFNALSDKIPGLYYGRFDIKYNTLEELKQGKNFKFLEVNGIIAEPTHIYDANKGTYFEALKTIREFWETGYKIAVENHKNGVEYMSFKVFWKEIFNLLQYYKKIKQLSKNQ